MHRALSLNPSTTKRKKRKKKKIVLNSNLIKTRKARGNLEAIKLIF
jgi:hypothetical protein